MYVCVRMFCCYITTVTVLSSRLLNTTGLICSKEWLTVPCHVIAIFALCFCVSQQIANGFGELQEIAKNILRLNTNSYLELGKSFHHASEAPERQTHLATASRAQPVPGLSSVKPNLVPVELLCIRWWRWAEWWRAAGTLLLQYEGE